MISQQSPRFLLLLLIVALQSVGVPGEEVPAAQVVEGGTFTDHGRVCRNFRFYWPTAQLCFDRNLGREILLVVDNAGRLLAIDFETRTTTPYPLPVRGSAWHAKRTSDGTLWIGLGFGKAELVRFDPTARKYLAVAQRPADAAPARIICDLTEGDDGRVYYTTAPQAQLWRYDPEKKSHELLKQIDSDNKYPYCITTGFGGRIFIAMASDHDRLWCYDPADGKLVNMTPERFQTPGHWERPVAVGKWVVYTWYDRKKDEVQLHLYDGERREFVKAIPLPEYKHYTGDNSNLVELPGGRVAVKVARGRFREVRLPLLELADGFDLEDAHGQMLVRATRDGKRFVTGWGQEYGVVASRGGEIQWRLPDTEPTPHAIFALHGHEDGLVYGSAEVGNTIFWFDPKAGTSTNTGQITDTSGEVYGFCGHEGTLYMASYTWAVITAFDPTRPWRPGAKADSNPRTLGRIGDDQYRPVGGIHPGPRGRLVVGTAPNYGFQGGAFTLIDPKTDRMQVYRNRVPGGTVHEFATDGHVLFGYGGGEFFVFDLEADDVVFRRKMPGGPMVYTNERLYMVSNGGLVEFDVQRRVFETVRGISLRGVPRHSLRAGRDGHLWAISDRTLTRVDPQTRQQCQFTETRGKAYAHLTATPDGTWWFTSPDKMRLYSFQPPADQTGSGDSKRR
jgi:streptogramin lyase